MTAGSSINDQVLRLLKQSGPQSAQTGHPEFDILEMPLEGVAAYWLSVKKTGDSRRNMAAFLREEVQQTREPFIGFLLDLTVSALAVDRCAHLAQVRRETVLAEMQRKYVLMAIGLLGIASNENPQKVMIRFLSKFPIAPIFEKQVFEVAQVMLKNLDNAELDKARFLKIDHKLKPEPLIITLVFYCMLARRGGPEALMHFQEYMTSAYFRDGLELICDGFDKDFIKYRLELIKREVLAETTRKMNLSTDMMIALKNGITFEDMYLVARAYLP